MIRMTESAIQRMFVTAMPSYFSDNAKKNPAPAKPSTVSARKIGFLFMLQSFAEITAAKSRVLIAAMRR